MRVLLVLLLFCFAIVWCLFYLLWLFCVCFAFVACMCCCVLHVSAGFLFGGLFAVVRVVVLIYVVGVFFVVV